MNDTPKLHIAHIITRFIRGGADENTLLTCNGQAELGHKVTLICGQKFDQGIVDELHPDVTFICEPSLVRNINPINEIKCYRALKQWLSENKPDIVHTHESKAGIIGRIAAHFARITHIVHGVHILAFKNASPLIAQLYVLLERWAGKYTDAFIHVSPAMLDACKEYNIGNNSLHEVVFSGMELSRYSDAVAIDPAKGTEKHQTLPENPKFLVMSGTLEKRKRVAEFLPYFREICDRVPNAVLVIAGGGRELKHVQDVTSQLKLSNNVLALGYTTELPEWIALASIGVHAAKHEGLPRVVMQYIAAGNPVVATYLHGLNHVVKHNRNGYIVADLDGIVEPITSLLLDDDLYARMAKEAANMDMTPWDHRHMVSCINDVYQTVQRTKSNVE